MNNVQFDLDQLPELAVDRQDLSLALIRRILARIERPVYGVLGNHDTIRMVPDLEAMGIRMLLNECGPIERGGATIYLVGIDERPFLSRG